MSRLLVLVAVLAAVPVGAQTITPCAAENQTCAVTSPQRVYYGANNVYAVKDAQGPVACDNATFGDPVPYVVKACYLESSPASLSAACAPEGGTCTFTGTQMVLYGANGTYASRMFSGDSACNNATFGDPVPNVVKACYVLTPLDINAFSLVIASDTQFPWTPTLDKKVPQGDAEQVNESVALNIRHVVSMNTIAAQLGNVRGVILNGDLTAFGHAWQLEWFDRTYAGVPGTRYAGLGNHDYANNVDDSYQNAAANGMVFYLRDEMRRLGITNFDYRESTDYVFPESRTTITGSLAYSFDIGNVHFVQLNNYPLYKKRWENFVAGEGKRIIVDITDSISWLRNDLAQARNHGQAIILNMHDPGEHWTDNSDAAQLKAQFTQMLKDYQVSAVFAGHLHENIGHNTSDYAANFGSVPLFYSGSSSQGRYLVATFHAGSVDVQRVDASTNQMQSDFQFPLLTGAGGAAPVAVPKADGYVTFFNEGGYVARYTLSYVQGGETKSSSTGNLALGNKVQYSVPGDATNVSVKGEGQTGLVWAPWNTTFELTFDGPPNRCFKSYGTTLNQAWNNTCD